MPARPALLPRRVPAVALVLALGAAGCGSVEQAQRRTVEAELQSASTFLLDSRAVSVRIGLTDPTGTARAALTTGEDPAPAALADVLLGGSMSFTIDPTGERTVRDLQAMDPRTPAAEVFEAMSLALTVEADGGPVAQLRLVDGDVYAAVDLDRVAGIAEKGGEQDAADLVEGLAQAAPPELAPLVEDVQAGEWVRLSLTPYAGALDELSAEAPPTPSDRLAGDLLAAVRPFVTVTDAAGDAGERVLDVQVQAKKAVEALVQTFSRLAGPAAGVDPLPADALDGLGDGTAAGRITLQDGHLGTVALDLGSVVRLATTPGAPDLTGSTLTVAVDDTADEVVAPSPVSDVDVAELAESALGGLLGDTAA